MSSRAHLVVPTLVALVLRVIHLGYLWARDPLFLSPVVDSWLHVRRAYQVLDLGVLLPGIQAFYKGPLYTYVLSALFAVFGPRNGLVAAYLFSVACGTLSVWLIASIATRLGGPRAGWIAGTAAALYGTAIYFDTSLLLVPLVTVLLLAAAERLVLAPGCERPGRALLVAGLLLGLVSITRANGLLALAAAGLWAVSLARDGRLKTLTPMRAAALVVVPALVVVAPVTARNALLEDDPVLVSWNGGINLYMGNDPAFDQTSGNWHPALTWTRLYDAPFDMGSAKGSQHQRFFLRQAVDRFVDDPLTGVRILGRKTALLFTAYEIQNNRRIEPMRERSPVLRWLTPRLGPAIFPYLLVVPLIGVGLALLDRRRLLDAAPLWILAAAWVLSPILFFNTARFRLSAILLLLPAAAAAASLPATWSRRRIAGAVAIGLALAVTAVITVPAAPTLPPSDELSLADVALREGRMDDALTWLTRAVEADPDDPFARMRLGDRLWQARRSADALRHYAAILQRDDLAADWKNAAMRATARCLWARWQPEESAAWYRRFLAAEPDRPMTGERPDFHLSDTPPLRACLARLDLADGLLRNGKKAAARDEVDRVLADCPGAPAIAARARRLRSSTD